MTRSSISASEPSKKLRWSTVIALPLTARVRVIRLAGKLLVWVPVLRRGKGYSSNRLDEATAGRVNREMARCDIPETSVNCAMRQIR